MFTRFIWPGVVEKYNSKNIKVFPNPVADCVTIENVQGITGNSDYQISDILGQTMMSGVFNDKITLNIKDYTKGIYILKIIQENKQTKAFKLMKE